jgi:hypothetical protein
MPRCVKAVEVSNGPCVTVLSKSGRRTLISADHLMLTQRGWVPARELHANHFLIRVCAEVEGTERLPDAELDFITLMLFEGGCSDPKHRLLRFTAGQPEVLAKFMACTAALGIGVTHYDSAAAIDFNIKGGESGMAAKLLRKHGLAGCHARNKRLPPAFFDLPLDQKYGFLSLMFATDGFVVKRHNQLAVTLASEFLIDDISLLLDTCGVPNRKYQVSDKFAGAWTVVIGASHVKRLAGKLDLLHKQAAFLDILAAKARDSTIFGYPYEVMKGLHTHGRSGKKYPKPAFTQPKVTWGNVGASKMERLIALKPSLVSWQMNDFIYDRVFKVEATDDHDVLNLEIDEIDYGAKNYIANGYVVHSTKTEL